jgi:SNF2-related domain
MHFVPGRHQLIGAEYLIDHPRCMFVADPGLGKTSTTLTAAGLQMLTASNFFPALVLAPKRVADVVWTGERDKWDAFQDLSMIKVMGEEDVRRAQLKRAVADIYIINYELVPWLVDLWPQEKWPFRSVIPDECSKLKGFRLNKGGKRAAALAKIARWTQYWWNLTGTPIPNGLQDLWGQMWFVDFGERLKRSYTAYMEAFFMEHPYTHRISPQAGAEAMIHDLVKDVMISFRAEDWLDITKPQEIPVEFDLNPAAQARYDEMERTYFMEIDDRQIEAGTAMVKSAKLLQIVAGSIYDHESDVHNIHDDRLQTLDGVLEQLADREQLLVSYWWKTDVPRIMKHLEKLGVKARVYNGQKDEDDWNARKYRVLLLQEQSAFGLNLHEPCRDVFFYTYTWSGELWTQFINRVGPTRQAQAGKKCVVRVWYAKARGTIDSAVVDSNFGKITVEQALKRARAQRYV